MVTIVILHCFAGHMINCLNNQVEEAVVKGWYQMFLIIEVTYVSDEFITSAIRVPIIIFFGNR